MTVHVDLASIKEYDINDYDIYKNVQIFRSSHAHPGQLQCVQQPSMRGSNDHHAVIGIPSYGISTVAPPHVHKTGWCPCITLGRHEH